MSWIKPVAFPAQTKFLITDIKEIYFKLSLFFGMRDDGGSLNHLPLNPYQPFMAKFDANSTLKRLQNRYRLVVMNDDTYEEVVTFKLSRMSVYITLSTIFVLLTGLTVALIVFTPLRLYIPGYGDFNATKELRELKVKTDSLEQAVRYKEQYLDNIKNVLQGNESLKLDTTQIDVPKSENVED